MLRVHIIRCQLLLSCDEMPRFDDVRILCLIPARSGSVTVPHKNVRELHGIPLLAYSIRQAMNSRYASQMRIIVSTDSSEYASVARVWGAECPFLRPPEISGSLSTDLECAQHSLEWLRRFENYIPDVLLQLRPTQPLRKVEDIDKCMETFLAKRGTYDSLRSVVEVDKSPFKMYTISSTNGTSEDSMLTPLFGELDGMVEPFNMARQVLPRAYLHNGYIDLVNVDIILKGKLSGEKIYPYVMGKEDNVDIDTEADWQRAEQLLQRD